MESKVSQEDKAAAFFILGLEIFMFIIAALAGQWGKFLAQFITFAICLGLFSIALFLFLRDK